MRIVFATQNPGKLHEMRQLLTGLSIEVVSAVEVGITDEVKEDAKTFEENALKKARFVAQKSKTWALADDSGICIDALDGAPGVETARWAGPRENLIPHTLKKMKNIPEGKRQATFYSVVALVSPNGEEHIFKGEIHGELTTTPHGIALPQLPYDVIFIPKGYKQTFAQMPAELKNSISHRGLAFIELKKFLQSVPGVSSRA